MLAGWEEQLWILFRVGVAALLGAVIGAEREQAGKPAGMRTHMLVCAGSAFLMCLGDALVVSYSKPEFEGIVRADPIRVMHGIILGISFLGAGTIVTVDARLKVEGLTTAASVWVVTAVGLATGMRQYVLAVGVTAMIMLILTLVRVVELKVGPKSGGRWEDEGEDER